MQYQIFYKEWIRIVIDFIKTRNLKTYSYNMFLGTDFYSAMGYYCTGDIFLPLLLVFRNNIEIGLLIETLLCIYISALTMSSFLKYKKINEKCIVFISLIYSLGGSSVIYIYNFMFHRFYSFLPLVFLGVEMYFAENRKSLFVFSIFILFLQNYYFMYMTLIFLLLYCVAECLTNNLKAKEIFHHFLVLLVCIVIGFMMSAFVTLPSMLSILGNVAVRTSADSGFLWNLNTIVGLLSSIVIVNPIGSLPSIFDAQNDWHSSFYNLYISIIPLSYLFYFEKKNSNNQNNKYRYILLIILLIILFIRPLNTIMHGFSFPSLRWVFLLNFYLLYLSALKIDFDKKNKNIFFIILFIYFCLLSFLVIFQKYSIYNYREHILFICVNFVFNIIISFFYFYNYKHSLLLVFISLFLSNFYCFSRVASHEYMLLVSDKEIDYYQDYDYKTYRYYYSYLNSYDGIPFDSNSSLLSKIMTTSTYSSTYDTSISKFLSMHNSYISNEWNIEISDPYLLTMLGCKYFIFGNRMDKFLDNYQNKTFAYSANDFSDLNFYYNDNFQGFGYSARNLKYTNQYSGNTSDFVNYTMIDDSDIDISSYRNLSTVPLNIIEMDGNRFKADISLDSNNILLIPLPNNKGWSININGKPANPISVNGGFIGLILNEGYNYIEMNFHTPYLKVSLYMSLFAFVMFILINIDDKKKLRLIN